MEDQDLHRRNKKTIGYGVIKMNIDTDLQWGFTINGARDYFTKYNEYVQS